MNHVSLWHASYMMWYIMHEASLHYLAWNPSMIGRRSPIGFGVPTNYSVAISAGCSRILFGKYGLSRWKLTMAGVGTTRYAKMWQLFVMAFVWQWWLPFRQTPFAILSLCIDPIVGGKCCPLSGVPDAFEKFEQEGRRRTTPRVTPRWLLQSIITQ